MPGDNCSIFGCSVSRSKKFKGTAIFKVPSGDDDFNKGWRDKLINVITRDRVIDSALKDRIQKKRLFICERHFRPDQILKHDSRSSLQPGEIPELNLPLKSFTSPPSTPRQSTINSVSKRLAYQENLLSSSTLTSPTYKSFDEFQKRVHSLKLTGWTLTSSCSVTSLSFMDDVHLVPKFEIFVKNDLTFLLRVFLWNLPVTHKIFSLSSHSFKFTTLSSFISSLDSYNICPGIDVESSLTVNEHSFIKHAVPKKILSPADIECNPSPLFQTEFIRAKDCDILSEKSSSPLCVSCTSLLKKETVSLKRKLDNLTVPAKPNAPIKFTAPEKVKLTLQQYRLENKSLKLEVEQMREQINLNSIPVNQELNNDMIKIISDTEPNKMPPFMKFFWEEQQQYLGTQKNGIRYHPAIIRFCLSLAAKSPSAYDDLRYDEKSKTGLLVLPSRRRLRDYKNCIRPQRGFNPEIVKELKVMVKDFSGPERYVTILIDEMKIQEDLVWDKHTGELIGYVDLGDKEVNLATLKNSEAVASHILVFLVRSVVNPLKFTFANFATKDVHAVNLFPIFWKAVGILEDNCNLKVVAVTSDGASSNRTFYKMHLKMSGSVLAGEDCVIYKTLNIHADEDRYIHFICDQPHIIKTARNNLSHSSFNQSSRLMWNDGYYMIWGHISRLVTEDLESHLKWCPKMSIEHINLTPFTRMNVRLAAQVLSESVSSALTTFGPTEAKATAEYCLMFDKFFDCMNVRNSVETKSKMKPFLAPFTSVDDERFTWLINEFLSYFSKWRKSIEQRPGKFTPTEKAKMFISWQTLEAVQMTSFSVIDLIRFLLHNGVDYVFTERFCQDPLENYFGRQRSLGRRSDNPTIQQFGYNDNTIRRTKAFKPIQSGNSRDSSDLFTISNEKVPCRPRNVKK